jgi:hypothetical protein
MAEFKPLNDRKQKKSTKITALIAGIVFVILGIMLPSIYSIVIGGIILLAATVSKHTVINEKGIEVRYSMFAFKYVELWAFSEITEMHLEVVKDPRYSALHFTKDVISKRLIFTKEEARGVIKLASEQNPKIHYDQAY